MTALNRAVIIDACIALIEAEGVQALTVRRLGDTLGVDPTAFYRHFRDKRDLLSAIGDRLHRDLLVEVDALPGGWRMRVREICRRLRAAHLARPDLAALISTAPPLQDNEFQLTEALLAQFQAAGLSAAQAALAYHAVIEVTVGSAAIDAPLAAQEPSARAATYHGWRRLYAALDEQVFPHTTAVADHLYVGDAEERFLFALDLLLDGLEQRLQAVM